MKQIPPIKAVMTPFPHRIGIDAPVRTARALIDEHGFTHLPVMDDERLVGVLRAQDIRAAADGTRVGQLAREQAYVVGLSEPLDRVLTGMIEHQHDSALVVKDGKLAGIFTVTDACRCFAHLLHQLFPRSGDDDAA